MKLLPICHDVGGWYRTAGCIEKFYYNRLIRPSYYYTATLITTQNGVINNTNGYKRISGCDIDTSVANPTIKRHATVLQTQTVIHVGLWYTLMITNKVEGFRVEAFGFRVVGSGFEV